MSEHRPIRPAGRGGLYVAVRALTAMWAAFWAATFAVGVFADADSLVVKLVGLAFVAVIGASPLAAHILWGRANPVGRPGPSQTPHLPRPAGHPTHSPLWRLERVTEAAGQLVSRAWIDPADHQAIGQRIARLRDLAIADQQSVALGGMPSTRLEEEIDQLHRRVIGILDASINTSAVAPGDADLDARLQHHLDRLHSRGAAVSELEGRMYPQPGT